MKLLRDCQRQPGSRVLRLKGAAGDPAVGKYARLALAMDHAEDGGPGSGNHGHAGRPGQRGGSAKGSGYSMAPGRAAVPSPNKRVSAKDFVPALQAAKDAQPETARWRVDSYRTAEDFEAEGIAVHTTEGGSTFAIKPDGDIISVCKNAKTDRGTNARDLMAAAVEAGGTHLDSYAGNFGFYTKCGFEVVSRCKFDPQYAPPGWDASRDKKEDIVFMRYVGVGKVQDRSFEAVKRRVPYSASYDDAAAALESVMRGEAKK
ncbi:MAG: hypothetical protein IJ153_10975 [Clostridia bacterium]|nr:hypothetical protein [Clostridia bacterium]MBQ9212209.1 hypothetical protein [Clostridia bacterium]